MRPLSGEARRAVFAPLDDGASRGEAVVRRVGSAIALGLLGDGEQLPAEADMAAQLGVSTVTLRDALADLRERGLVETRRGRGGGSFVRARDDALAALADVRLADLGSADLRELGDVHAAVAGAAAALAATRVSPSGTRRLREVAAAVAATVAASDRVPEQRRADGRFYVEVAACAQSVRLTRLQMELLVELGQLPWAPAGRPDLLQQVAEAHRAVVESIEAGNPAAARERAERHVGARTRWLVERHLRAAAGEGGGA